MNESERLAKLKQDAADIQKLIIDLESKAKRFKPELGGKHFRVLGTGKECSLYYNEVMQLLGRV